ncbi:uncharacterized protein [Drosophila takahashii]|uniref:uncharacterized protein n=1 Tax=Drosophila takahashii TaxID=29030 RepID=UPI001CF8D456|nr:uncharacterized protein LOC108054944 [Drosophila takahashii]XP_016993555.2 uncharacterized protein LOC108054944 [Drosophila takahashii]
MEKQEIIYQTLKSRHLPTNPSVLLNWVNALIGSDFDSLKHLRSGIVWCRLLEALCPGSIDLDALQYDKLGWLQNYRVLRRSLKKLGYQPLIDVSELVAGKIGDTIYLLHFFIDLFNATLGRKIKEGTTSDPKGSSMVESVMQWFKSFFVKESEEAPEKKTEAKIKEEFNRQALLLLFVPESTGEMVQRPTTDHQRISLNDEQARAYRLQKDEDHRILRLLVNSITELRRGRHLMEQQWLASLREQSQSRHGAK